MIVLELKYHIKNKYQNVVVTLGSTVVSDDVESEAGSPHAKKLGQMQYIEDLYAGIFTFHIDRIKARYPWWDGINKVWNEFRTLFPLSKGWSDNNQLQQFV